MSKFIFKSYDFNKVDYTANFNYGFDDGRNFTETVKFEGGGEYNEEALDRALFLTFILAGTSYYKTFPTRDVELSQSIDDWQTAFFNSVYQKGLGQFAYENGLSRDDLVHFETSERSRVGAVDYEGHGILALQSGGKDSLLVASLLEEKGTEFTSLYVSSTNHYPAVLRDIGSKLVICNRMIDRDGLKSALKDGAKNGHVPVTYIIQSLAVIQAILLNKRDILTSIAHEGEEPHDYIGDLKVTHQWSKTWAAEVAFSEYVKRYISAGLRIGSPLRCYSELKVAELFVGHAGETYGHMFSSCNLANYKQGSDNSILTWCGKCPKCVNSYLLFAPFVPADELKVVFGGRDLFTDSQLVDTFKGLLGIDGFIKPFECVGEVDELRLAYHLALKTGGFQTLPFDVPDSSFDYQKTYPAQDWAAEMLQ